jgi:hypothetical protein
VLLGFPVFAFLYFVLMGPAMMLINFAGQFQNLPPQALTTINLWLSILTWLGMDFLVSMIVYAISNAQKRGPYE